MRMKKREKWKTVFQTYYNYYEYLIMLFKLINILIFFQSLINNVLKKYLDQFCIIYLNNILIYSEIKE